MIKGYLIEKYSQMTNAYTCNRLVEEAKELGIELSIIGVHDVQVRADGLYHKGNRLEKRDFVINRYKWGLIKEELNTLAEKSYNPIREYDKYINKYEQIKRLSSEAYLIPKYLLTTSQGNYEEMTAYLGTPFVVKGLESSMGAEVLLIEQKEAFYQLGKRYGVEKEWLCEEFIKTSIGKDMRFFSIRGEVVAGMIRKSQGDFRANVALGATVEPCEITSEIQKIAKDIYEQTGLDFLGIDLMFGETKQYFCEINVMPGIEGMETASRVNVAKKIMETIKSDFEV